ncbi:MAG: hypothetical protein R3Y07_07060 [Eubacteriales bacterium]
MAMAKTGPFAQWMQDFRDTRNYYKQEKEQSLKLAKYQQEIEKIKEKYGDTLEGQEQMLNYRNNNCEAASAGVPNALPKKNESFWARMFFKKTSPAEVAAYTETKTLFSTRGDEVEKRKQELNTVKEKISAAKQQKKADQMAEVKNDPVKLDSVKKALSGIQEMRQSEEKSKQDFDLAMQEKQKSAQHPLDARLGKMGPALMGLCADEAEKTKMANALSALSDEIGDARKSRNISKKVFNESVKHITDKLTPLVERINAIDLTQIDNKNLDWYTPEVAKSIQQFNAVAPAMRELSERGFCTNFADNFNLHGLEEQSRGSILKSAGYLAQETTVSVLADSIDAPTLVSIVPLENKATVKANLEKRPDMIEKSKKSYIDRLSSDAKKSMNDVVATNGKEMIEVAAREAVAVTEHASPAEKEKFKEAFSAKLSGNQNARVLKENFNDQFAPPSNQFVRPEGTKAPEKSEKTKSGPQHG